MLCTTSAFAQDGKPASKVQENTIEGLSFYPNPVSNGKIYISSKSNDEKQITIFDVLGKKVLQTLLTSRELKFLHLSLLEFTLLKLKKVMQVLLEN